MKKICLLVLVCLCGLGLSGQKVKVDTINDKMYNGTYYEVRLTSKDMKGMPVKSQIITTVFRLEDIGITFHIGKYTLADNRIMVKFDDYDPVEYKVLQSDNITHYIIDDKYTFLQSLNMYAKKKIMIRANIMRIGYVDFEYNTIGAGDVIYKHLSGDNKVPKWANEKK